MLAFTQHDNYCYPDKETLFRPDRNYPEYPFQLLCLSGNTNKVYDQVRETLHLMKLDDENYETHAWNPLGGVVNPGDYVLIKPNMVMDVNKIPEYGTDCLYTHPSVVAAVIDYVLIALKGKGKIVIGDAPVQECKFDKLLDQSGYLDLINWYKTQGINIEIVDFRGLTSEVVNGLVKQTINTDSRGKIVDLGQESEFAGVENYANLRISNYDPTILATHHTNTKNEYYVSDYVLNADVIINMPKPKSHRKAGLTAAMKNLIGISVRKEFLPHHSLGSQEEDGDEYLKRDSFHAADSLLLDWRNKAIANGKRSRAQLYRLLGKAVRTFHPHEDFSEGSWYGNNTISKTICDLNKIALYCDKNGKMQDEKQRKFFIIADMIVMGESEGPLAPSSKNAGVIAIGSDQVLFDEAVAEFVGYDKKKLPFLVNARNIKGKYILCESEIENEIVMNEGVRSIRLEPASGWKGHIEKA